MGIVIMVAQLILALSILVFIHELGHFLAAKAFNIKVEKFFIFFDAWGKKLFSFKYGETEYGFGWLPLGGYVKIAGMIDESMDKEQMNKEPEPWEFRSKPRWQRLIVMIGGIVMNIILGVIIFSLVLLNFKEKYIPADEMKHGVYAFELAEDIGIQTGDKLIAINGDKVERSSEIRSAKLLLGESVTIERDGELKTIDFPKGFIKKFIKNKGQFMEMNLYATVGDVDKKRPAGKIDIKPGDRILSVNGEDTKWWWDFNIEIRKHADKEVNIEILRDGQRLQRTAQLDSNAILGVSPALEDSFVYVDYTLGSAFSFGSKDAFSELFYQSMIPLAKLVTGQSEMKASETVAGPIGIATMFGSEWEWGRFWKLTGLISMVLAFMNFLPIPALDGGHIMFILIEMVSRRKLSDNFLEKAQMVGMIILLALMVLIFGNDIFRLIK